jgi:hypothetical protein
VKRHLVGAVVLAGIGMSAFVDISVAKDPKPASMRFEWRTEGPAQACGEHCRTWIAATGVITDETARAFEAFARTQNVRGATLVLDSEGGSVLSAMALGRAVRSFEMTTTVGRTMLLTADADGIRRATLSPQATCESMCAFVLLAGVRRYVPAEARVLVHQIWLGSKSKRARDVGYSADELHLVQRDVGKLARYTIEMGGGIELIETSLQVPPWEPMHRLTTDELRRMRLTTVDHLFEPPSAGPAVATVGAPESTGSTTSAQGRR